MNLNQLGEFNFIQRLKNRLDHMSQSHGGAHMNVDKRPLSSDLLNAAYRFNWNASELALTAEEDYCLLATVDAGAYPTLNQA